VSELAELLDDLIGDDEWSRHARLERLRTGGAATADMAAMARFLQGDDPARRAAARMAMAALATPVSPVEGDARRRLEAALRADDPDLRVMAASAMGESGNDRVVPALVAALEDPHANVVAAVADALGALAHPASLRPLVDRLDHPDFWVRMAALVAIGQLRDPAALPALERAGATPGLEAGVVEAVRNIGDPAGLPVLEQVYAGAAAAALDAAGVILAAHPGIPAPGWIQRAARDREPYLRDRLRDDDDPALARLLGLAGTEGAILSLLDLVGPPRRSEAAIAGLLAVPDDARAGPILQRLDRAEAEDRVMLLSLLPPVRDPEHVARIIPLLADPQPRVRAAAAEALSRSPDQPSLAALTEELGRDTVSPEVVRAAGALGSVACGALTPLLRDQSPAVRAAAADALARCADPAVAEHVTRALEEEDVPAARRSLLRSLACTAGSAAVPVLRAALTDPDAETRMVAIESLGATASVDAIPSLEGALAGEPGEVLAAIRALGELQDPEVLPLIEPFLASDDLEERRTVVASLGRLAGTVGVATLVALADDPDPWIRGRAVRMLAERGGEARATLEGMAAGDPDPRVRAEARRSLDGAT
jgi:cellulose synthase operon protein C